MSSLNSTFTNFTKEMKHVADNGIKSQAELFSANMRILAAFQALTNLTNAEDLKPKLRELQGAITQMQSAYRSLKSQWNGLESSLEEMHKAVGKTLKDKTIWSPSLN